MFNRLKNRVLSAVTPDLPPLPSASSTSASSSHHHHHHHHHSSSSSRHNQNPNNLPDKFAYARPPFLQLCSPDELRASADHNVRPIIVPRDVAVMPWHTGYAECVNSGKSEWNEDQAAFQRHTLSHPQRSGGDGGGDGGAELPYIYFGTFDGHAGYGAALAASHQFHHILHEKLVDVIEMLLPAVAEEAEEEGDGEDGGAGGEKRISGLGRAAQVLGKLPHPQTLFQKTVTRDELIIGALESAFAEMDALLAEDRDKYRNAGGCTALVSLFILGKLFVANAGDSRAVLCQRRVLGRQRRSTPEAALNGHSDATHDDEQSEEDENETDKSSDKTENKSASTETDPNLFIRPSDGLRMLVYPTPCSFDHTPDTERARLLTTARLNPALMGGGGDYVAMEYGKRPQSRDLGTRILYRQGAMRGWAYKTLQPDDLRQPIVSGEGKRSRLLSTIGVTRGFGDHDLRALYTQLPIKPFLSAHPEVRVWDLAEVEGRRQGQGGGGADGNADGEFGVLVMATDGLWDVSEPDQVARTVFGTLERHAEAERHRYTMVAQELVARARGRINEAGHWRLAESKAAATVDDISVMVVPVAQYWEEWRRWEAERRERREERRRREKAAQRGEAEAEAEVVASVSGLDDVRALTAEMSAIGGGGGILRMGETADGEETIAVELIAAAADGAEPGATSATLLSLSPGIRDV